MKPREIRKGDMVRVIGIPGNLHERAGIGTPRVFESALGKTFRVEGIGEYGHLELVVSCSDTIWIEPESSKLWTMHRKPSNQSVELTAACCEVYVSRG